MPLGWKEHMWPLLVHICLACTGGRLTHTHFAVGKNEADRDVNLLTQVTQAGESIRTSIPVSLPPAQHSSTFT